MKQYFLTTNYQLLATCSLGNSPEERGKMISAKMVTEVSHVH